MKNNNYSMKKTMVYSMVFIGFSSFALVATLWFFGKEQASFAGASGESYGLSEVSKNLPENYRITASSASLENKKSSKEPHSQHGDEQGVADKPDRDLSSMITAEGLLESLQDVRLDRHGDVILDHETLLALNKYLEQKDFKLSALGLEQLKELIQYALPGKEGSQAALIVGNYYQYLEAQKEFDELHSDSHLSRDYAAREKEVQKLRQSYLGEEVEEKLFSQSDAEKRFMYDSFQISSDKNLSPKDRDDLKKEAKTRYVNKVLEANGWSSRYDDFVKKREAILASDSDSKVTQDEIKKAFDTYFDAEEKEKMTRLQISVDGNVF